jgi:penicillin amidase
MKEGFSTLANDPHLALGLPSFLNFARIETPDFEVMGAFIPLSPYPVIGMSQDGAWGMTFSEIDQADFYEGQINGDKLETATQVKFGEAWTPLEKRRELIKVSGSDDVAVVYAKTKHAVVLNDATFNPTAGDGKILLSSDVSLFQGNRHLQSVRSLALSISKEDFRSTIKYNRAPPQNVFWVGATGEAAWGVAGWVAQRNWNFKRVLKAYFPNHNDTELEQFSKSNPGISNIPGSLVMPYAPEFMWTKTSTAADFAYSDQFKGNCMGNANEQLTSDVEGTPSIASTNWALPLRSKRISELLNSTTKFDEQAFMKFQTDVKDNFADEILPKILDLPLTNLDANGQDVLERLKSWDRMSAVDSKGQLAFELLMFNWRTFVLRGVKELSEENLEIHGKQNSRMILGWASMLSMSKESGGSKLSYVSLIESSLEKSFNGLKEYYASNGFSWERSNWGELHTFGPEHTFASIPVIGRWFKYPSMPISGSTHSLAVQSYNKTYATKDFRSKSGAGLRFIAMPERGIAWTMFPTGASGVPGANEFYRNQREYIAGNYNKLTLNSAKLKAGQSVSHGK